MTIFIFLFLSCSPTWCRFIQIKYIWIEIANENLPLNSIARFLCIQWFWSKCARANNATIKYVNKVKCAKKYKYKHTIENYARSEKKKKIIVACKLSTSFSIWPVRTSGRNERMLSLAKPLVFLHKTRSKATPNDQWDSINSRSSNHTHHLNDSF